MKKFTMFMAFLLLISWQGMAQFTESFEGAGTPTGWTVINNGDANTWYFTTPGTGTANSGTQVARIDYDINVAHDDYLITSQIAVTDLVSDRLTFYAKSRSATFLEDFNVLISTTGTNVGDFTINLAGSLQTAPSTWTMYQYDLSAYEGQNIYIAIQAVSLNEWELYIDDFTIDGNPNLACPDPSALTATNFTATSADLAWIENGSATTWDIEWGATGFTPTGTPTIIGTTTNPHNLTGLTAQTSYDYYVRADCGGNGVSAWVGPFTFTTPCAVQLAGTYTIGTTGNYATFTDAVNALSCGISAPVIFNVLAGSGPFNEQITLTPVIGANATNTITFNGNGETITFSTSTSPNNYIIRLDGADYITFDNLNLVSQSTTNNFGIHLTNDADYNTINNCTVDLTSTFSSTGTTNAGIVVSGTLDGATDAGTSGTNNTFTNNTIIGGYYGITINGVSSSVNSLNNTITNNNIQNYYTYGLYFRSISNSTISNNEMSRMTRSPLGSFYGIYFITSGENNLIEANEIHDAFTGVGGASTSLAYPIFHSSVDATVGNENRVVNNLIYNINTNGTIYGIYNSGSDGVHYYHNTISLDDAASTGGTTRGFYQTTTASDIEFKNNIVTVTKGGTGTKYCIYFGSTTSTITTDNNVFYINAPAGTNNLGYYSAAQNTLVDWQTASSQDANSSDADPIYANILSNDLTPTNVPIDGIADVTVGVANDFYGIARAATPDPGAIEFTPPACAQPSSLVVTNITNSSADLGWTENGTATMWDIEWGAAGFTPTGTPTIVGTTTNPHNITGLTDLTTYDFYVRADCGGTESGWSGPFSFTTTCGTPLAGNYTIGATGTYPTFTDAVNALLACGISAPVVFDVLTGSGPYNEQVTITPITGTSATNTITFNGNGETITSTTATGSRSLILLDGAKHVTINDLILVPQSSTNNFTVQLTSGADSNTVNNCTIDLTAAISSTATTNAGIVISGSLTSATSTTQPTGNYNTIINNTVIGGYYGITIAGGNNNNITGNDVQDVYYYGIYHSAVNNTITSNNKVSRPNRTSVSTTAYYAIYYTGNSENNLANANELFNPLGSTTSTPTIYLIGHSSVDATVGNENIVTNNIIRNISGNATVYGLYNSGSDGVFYYHNTVSIDDINSTSGTTRGFYQTTIASGIEFKNNIITITRGGTGTKYCIYFGSTTSTIISDNNVFYINAPAGTNNLGYYSAAQNTLVDWQTASSQDANSSDASPLYVNLSANDLTPSNPSIDGMANAAVGVANDFYGTTRAATPDPGAIEFMPPTCIQPSALNVTNMTYISADLGWTENGTATTWDIEWGVVGFTPTGTPNVVGTTTNPHNLTGLTANTSYDFYVRSDCGGSGISTWAGPFTFYTGYCTPSSTSSSTYVNNFTTIGGSVNISNLSTGFTTGGYLDATAQIVESYPNGSFDFNAEIVGGTVGFSIWIDWNNDLVFDNSTEKVFNTTSFGNGPFTGTINIPISAAIGNYRMRITADWNANNPSDPCAARSRAEFEDYTISIAAPPSCPAPSALTASNFTTTSADLGWTENGTATTWDIEWGTAGFTPTGIPTIVGTTTNPHNLTGLTTNTAYEFYVRADCGGSGTSTWAGPYSFFTGYCTPSSTSSSTYVNNFTTIGGSVNISNLSTGFTTGGYLDATAQIVESYPNGSFDFNAEIVGGTVGFSIWIDWNNDLVFDNSTEKFFNTTAYSNGPFTNTINIPTGASLGNYTMRIAADWNSNNPSDPCAAISRGEFEDYTISIVAPPSCPAPSTLTATAITAISADLGWTENGTATTWDIEWGTAGFTPTGIPTIVGTTTNPHNLTGLTGNTTYEFYVRAICSVSDSSNWSGPFAFTTACGAVTTFPFLEDFEATSNTRDCWTQIEEIGTASWTYATGSSGGAITTAYSGTENARFVSQSGTNSPVVKLVSPVLDLSSVNSPELAFFYGQEFWSPDQNELKVYYRTSTTGTWTQIAHYTTDVPTWTADTLTLPNPSATYQIAFEGINNFGRANVVDDVEVYDAFTCSDPSNLTAFNIQPTSAMLDWTENGTATNWNIEWDVTGFTLGTGNPQAVAAKPYLLQGLTPGTVYDYYVQADCGLGDTSNWVGPFTFTTPPCMPIGLDLGVDTALCSNQNILLDAGAGNYTYSWSTGGTTQTELIDTTLMGGNGTYNITVTVTDVISGCIYTDDINITFQTCTDIDELGNENAIAIYPNPTNGLLNVMINGATINTTLTIVDVQGKVVYSRNNFTNSASLVETIDLSGNDKGIYFISLTTDKATVVKKVILH